ncbi:MAG TPA: phosphate ABC transporter permease PstA [Thermoplasmata archaeon]|nr:phosphate ABC transporter permease PstA [Thermoplasmata archaeon]
MRRDRRLQRRITSYAVAALCVLCVAFALIPLGSILYAAFDRGLPALNVGLLTTSGPPAVICPAGAACPSGGINNAIIGTALLVGLAALVAFPVGALTGIYLSEYGDNRIGRSVRFFVNVMSGIPSIVVGIVVFSLMVYLAEANVIESRYIFSTAAGSLALGLIMVPVVARTTDESLRLVPTAVREAALALGIRRYRTILRVVFPAAGSGVLTGALLATARAAGETAPLLMTAFGNTFGFQGLNRPVAALPLVIYYYGISGIPRYETIAWGSALLLVLAMLLTSLAARYAFARTRARSSPA